MSYDLAGFDPVDFATRLQAGANRLTANINRGATLLQNTQRKLNTTIDAVTGATMTAGQVVQGVTRGGIATAATGNAGTGLAAASASTGGGFALVVAGLVATWFVFAKHPGGRKRW
jgi:hypothetical protein